MASIQKTAKGYRTQIRMQGVRDSRLFPTRWAAMPAISNLRCHFQCGYRSGCIAGRSRSVHDHSKRVNGHCIACNGSQPGSGHADKTDSFVILRMTAT